MSSILVHFYLGATGLGRGMTPLKSSIPRDEKGYLRKNWKEIPTIGSNKLPSNWVIVFDGKP